MSEATSRMLTVYEAAELAGLHHQTIRERIRSGQLPTTRTKNLAYRIDPDDLVDIAPRKRFWQKVNKTETCWLWTGRSLDGYGVHAGKLAHRLAYEELVGPIPVGLQIDHLCCTPPCVNPQHLEPVTGTVNMQRRSQRQTHCMNGHEYAVVGSYFRKKNGGKTCAECSRIASRKYSAKKRAAKK